MALGKDIDGSTYFANLGQMPHVLISGTTGSGKSVSVNGMICSILYRASPRDVRFLMIDPKMLELSIYDGIPHLLLPPITDSKKAGAALNWTVGEMERRYQAMSEMGVRDLVGYNEKIKLAKMKDVPYLRTKMVITMSICHTSWSSLMNTQTHFCLSLVKMSKPMSCDWRKSACLRYSRYACHTKTEC